MLTNHPKITFITPYYNSEDTIGEMLSPLGCLTEGHRHLLEWIIVDDGSTEESYQKLINLSSPYHEVRTIRCTENKGASHARNVGIEQAKGGVLIFMDSDIQIYPQDLGKLIDQINSCENDNLNIFTAGVHHKKRNHFPTRYKNDYMNAIFAPYRGKRRNCSFIYGSLCGWKASYHFHWPDIRYGEDTYLAQKIISEGHKIYFDSGITLEHHKDYSLMSLLKNDFLIPFFFAQSFIDFPHPQRSRLSFSHSETWQLLAILISGLLLLSSYYPTGVTLALFLGWNITNQPLFREVLKGRNLKLKLFSYLFTMLDQWTMGFGILFGLIYTRFLRSPKVNIWPSHCKSEYCGNIKSPNSK